jgi:hypothetical protein
LLKSVKTRKMKNFIILTIAFTILSSVSLNANALQCYVCASCVTPDIGTLTNCTSNSSTVACSVDYKYYYIG